MGHAGQHHSNVRVIGYLGRALSFELSAVQQYMAHAALTEAWGLVDAGQQWRAEVVEEMRHAERIVQRMLLRGVAPNASQLRPVKCGSSLLELIEHNLQMEAAIIALYQDATLACLRGGDQDDGAFFQELLEEEKQHALALQAWKRDLVGGMRTAQG